MPGFLTPGLLFISSGPSSEFRFLQPILSKLRDGCTRFVEPCSGDLAMSHIARQAGISPGIMEASDVGLFGTLMGHAAMGERVDHLNIECAGLPEDTDLGDPATVLWAQAWARAMKHNNVYWQEIALSMLYEKDRHVADLRRRLSVLHKQMGGLSYRPMDMFKHLEEVSQDPGAIICLNPPTITSGYERFYDTRGRLTWDEPPYDLFDPVVGYEKLDKLMEEAKALIIMHKQNQDQDALPDAFLLRSSMRKMKKDVGISKSGHNYLVTNQLDRLMDVSGPIVLPWEGYKVTRPPFQLVDTDYLPTPDTKVAVTRVHRDEANYVRSLWTHKFSFSQFGVNFGVFLDGRLAALFGVQISHSSGRGLYGGEHDGILFGYGISAPSEDWRRTARLMIRLAMSRHTLEDCLSDLQLSQVKRLITVQLSASRESRTLRGLMKRVKVDKDPLHGYRVSYHGTIHEDTHEDVFQWWLKDEDRWIQARTKALSG